jgi:hypothetical protein
VLRYKFAGNMIDILKEYALIFIYFSCYNFVPVSSNVLSSGCHFEEAVYF